jgi:hypothetical protein
VREYIFIVKKQDGDDIIRKALYFKDLEEHLTDGWEFNTYSDKTIYQALYNFYMVMKNDTNRRNI